MDEKGSAYGHKAISFPSFSQSGDKKAVKCQANSPQPTGCRLDDRKQIKQKDKCSLGGSGSISDSSDPRQFLFRIPLPFFATQPGTNPVVKGDCREHVDALSLCMEL